MASLKDLENRSIQISDNIIVDIFNSETKEACIYVYFGQDPKYYNFNTLTAKDIMEDLLLSDDLEQYDELVNIVMSFNKEKSSILN